MADGIEPTALTKPAEDPHNIQADKYYIFNQTGNIMFASTEEMAGEIPESVRDLFAEVSVFFAAMTKAITSTPNPDDDDNPYSIYNYTALQKIINKSGLFVHVTETDYTHESSSFGITFSKELLEGLLGLATGAGALSFAQGMLSSMGKEGLKLGISNDRKDSKVANIVFVCEYLMGMPSVSALVVFCDTEDNKSTFEFGPCIKTETNSMTLTMHKDTYLFVTPEFVRKYSADLASVADNAEYNEFVEYLQALLTEKIKVNHVMIGDSDDRAESTLNSGGNYRITGANLQNVVAVRRRGDIGEDPIIEISTQGASAVGFSVRSNAVPAEGPELESKAIDLVGENDEILASTKSFAIGPADPLTIEMPTDPRIFHPIGFTAGKDVDRDGLKTFINAVDKDAEAVAKGIVGEIKKKHKKIPARVIKKGSKFHILCTEGDDAVPELGPDQIAVFVHPEVNITVTARTEDAPAIIDSLNRFFSSWRAVLGLIASGGAVLGGMWLMRVDAVVANGAKTPAKKPK